MSHRKKKNASPPTAERWEAGARQVEEPHRRWWIWLVYVLLFAASVPWYLPEGRSQRIWWGLPYWVVISLIATVGIAVFTTLVVRWYWRETGPTATLPAEEDRRS